MKYSELTPGTLFFCGVAPSATYSRGGIITTKRPIKWIKLQSGKAIRIDDFQISDLYLSLDRPMTDGVNNTERRHGTPVFSNSDFNQIKSLVLFRTLFNKEEQGSLIPFETVCAVPAGYTRRFGQEQRWTSQLSLPTVEEAKELGRINRAAGLFRWQDVLTCEAKGGRYIVVNVNSNLDGGSSDYRTTVVPDRRFQIMPVIRPSDDAELEPFNRDDQEELQRIRYRIAFPCALEEILRAA